MVEASGVIKAALVSVVIWLNLGIVGKPKSNTENYKAIRQIEIISISD